jgi:CRISPR/Cas system CMR-associated protein Cmr1 (group 7 of RAMP superfamily)
MPKTSQPELITEIESGKNKGSSSDDELELRGQSMRGDQ